MKIRTSTLNDLSAITEICNMCFPQEKAATRKDFEEIKPWKDSRSAVPWL